MSTKSRPLRHFITADDLSKSDFLAIVSTAEILESADDRQVSSIAERRTVAASFFDSSVRTSTLVHMAASRIGASHISISASPHEPATDVIVSLSDLADIVVVRNNSLDLESIRERVDASLVNGLCRGDEHALSGIWQLYCLKKRLGSLDGIRVGIYGQTSHCRPYLTLQKLLSLFSAEFFHDPILTELANPTPIVERIRRNGSRYELCDIREVGNLLDLVLVSDGSPMQKANDESGPLFERYCEKYRTVTAEYLRAFPPKTMINYMMPRLLADGRLTVSPEVDEDRRVYNAALMQDGVWGTAALFLHLFGIKL